MPAYDLRRRLAAEALGTALLVAAVVGSGIMAESLTKDTALALLCNTLATGAILVVLITIFAPISGAHFNPAVSLVFALKRDLPAGETGAYMAAQIIGGVLGTIAAHLMFALPLIEASQKARTGGPQWFAEAVAAFGLVTVILAGIRFAHAAVPWLLDSISPPPTGSPLRRPSPIPQWRSRARSPTHFPASARSTFLDS
jgi:glycerol uptake facilitator-like aquaporin